MWIKAAVLRSADSQYVIEDVELRDVHPGEVRLRIVATGMCHTDMLPRATGFIAQLPLVGGHESAGVVEAIGSGVTGVAVGDHVVASFDSCRYCANCVSGRRAYCDTFLARNLTGVGVAADAALVGRDGTPIASRWFGQSSFATHAIVSASNVVTVDPTLPLEIMGPLGCGVLTGAGSVWNSLAVECGSTVAIFGAGSVGLSAVMAARVAGAACIIAVDTNPDRLELALSLGATSALDGTHADLVADIIEISGGGVQFALDSTGVPSVIEAAVDCLRPTGTCGLVAAQQGDVRLGPTSLTLGKTVKGILVGDALPELVIPKLITLWQQQRFPFERLITRYPLEQINEAERASLRGEVVKPVLVI